MSSEAATIAPAPGAARHGLMVYGFWAFILLAVGRVNQMIPGAGSVPFVKVVLVLLVLAWLSQRPRYPELAADVRSLAKAAIWLAALAVILTPISVWRGSSLQFVTTNVPVCAASVVFALAMRRSWKAIRGTLLVLVVCGLMLAGVAISGDSVGSRAAAAIYDPNDLAYVLVTIIPLSVAFTISAKSIPRRLAYLAVGIILVIALLLTESRGGLLGFLASIALMTFIPAKPSGGKRKSTLHTLHGKLGVLFAVACVALLGWSQLPQAAQQRFSTLMHLGNDYDLNLHEKVGRADIWLRGLRAASERPIGYGPQTYELVDHRFGGPFKAPHNSLLQVLVELGILGLGFLLRMYGLSLRGLHRVRFKLASASRMTPEQAEQIVFAWALQASLVGNFISGLFLSQAYAEVLWIAFGCSMALMAISSEGRSAIRQPGRNKLKVEAPLTTMRRVGGTRSSARRGVSLREG